MKIKIKPNQAFISLEKSIQIYGRKALKAFPVAMNDGGRAAQKKLIDDAAKKTGSKKSNLKAQLRFKRNARQSNLLFIRVYKRVGIHAENLRGGVSKTKKGVAVRKGKKTLKIDGGFYQTINGKKLLLKRRGYGENTKPYKVYRPFVGSFRLSKEEREELQRFMIREFKRSLLRRLRKIKKKI